MKNPKLYRNILLLFPIVFPFVFNFFVEDTLERLFTVSIAAELIILFLFSLFFRRTYCSFFCLFGAGQRLVNDISLRLFKKRFVIPAFLDKYLRMIKYIILVELIVFSLSAESLLLEFKAVPFEQYSSLLPSLTWIGGLLAAATVLGSLLFNNFFCKYLCVKGALLGIAGRLSPCSIVRHADQCVECMLCSKKCPQNLYVHEMSKVVSMECIGCQNCIAVCPKKGALANSFGSKEIPNALFIAAAVFFYIFITFFVARII